MNRLLRRLLAIGFVAAAGLASAAPSTNAPGAAVNFNFDQVEIRVLVRLAGEMTGRRFVVDDSVKGRVTVVTPDRVPLAEVYPLLQSILESSGYTLVERADGTHVLPLAKNGMGVAPVVLEGDTNRPSGLLTKVIKVSHVSVTELKKLFDPMIRGGKDGAVAAFPETGHLILPDTAENIREAERIVTELDKPGASRTIEVVPLAHAQADEIAVAVSAAVKGADSAGERVSRHLQQVGEGLANLPGDFLVIPSPGANSLVLVGPPVQLAEVKRVIALMDIEPRNGFGRLHVIFLKYLAADEASKSINALLLKATDKDKRSPIALEANVANNALLVESSASDFALVTNLVSERDRMPQQVLVEILIVEVNGDKSLDFGVSLQTVDQAKDGSTVVMGRTRPGATDSLMDIVQKQVYPQCLAVGVTHGTYLDAAGNMIPNVPLYVEALAKKRDVRILSNVPLWAQNNADASVNVVENIPVLRSTIEGGSGTARDVIQNIDRLDVGIKLKLTPHVNPDGDVTMKLNPSIEAVIDQGANYSPTIAKREVNTTVTVPNEATVVISGLIREDKIKSVAKVPLLGDIPVLGWLFRYNSDSTKRTNLMILVTPHIVTDMKKANELKADIEKRSGIDTKSPDRSADQPVAKKKQGK